MSAMRSILKETRERKGISLEQAERDTNIRKPYLIGLEEGDYDQLPGRVYTIGFLRSYGKYLGLDPEPLIQEFKHNNTTELAETVEIESHSKETEKTVEAEKRSVSRVQMIGYGLAVLTLVGLFYISTHLSSSPDMNGISTERSASVTGEQNNQINESQQDEPAAIVQNANDEEVPVEEASVVQEEGVNITIHVRQDRSWVAVTQDGVPQYQGILYAGETMTFKGKEKVLLHVGNAGAVEVIYNGENLGPMGRLNDVEKKEFVRS
ncbi:helix-turn-helix domain-containing protein [Heliorestis convoluta]|uniref:Helix-turn-helix domain-containing protein n=1 Tax=Heliorestis convoluta TaxID=356322 RepID=A0A5Q2N3S5_9FIRM|nr:helix-turn-helix domain-containing protein [Heliorestis convoluta]QGG48246.1 helix-turn-helix domain-containing protein [Heliorestis convoluta]